MHVIKSYGGDWQWYALTVVPKLLKVHAIAHRAVNR